MIRRIAYGLYWACTWPQWVGAYLRRAYTRDYISLSNCSYGRFARGAIALVEERGYRAVHVQCMWCQISIVQIGTGRLVACVHFGAATGTCTHVLVMLSTCSIHVHMYLIWCSIPLYGIGIHVHVRWCVGVWKQSKPTLLFRITYHVHVVRALRCNSFMLDTLCYTPQNMQ